MAALPLMRDVAPRRDRAGARPPLAVVQHRRRWPALIAVFTWSLVFVGMLGAAVFHTQLAERQLALDRMDRQVTKERERFDELRYERAELRSPVHLASSAGALGMHRGRASTFVTVDAGVVARQLAAAGPIGNQAVQIIIHTDPLDQFRAVKNVTEGQ